MSQATYTDLASGSSNAILANNNCTNIKDSEHHENVESTMPLNQI